VSNSLTLFVLGGWGWGDGLFVLIFTKKWAIVVFHNSLKHMIRGCRNISNVFIYFLVRGAVIKKSKLKSQYHRLI
jgi:hypothetical protein